MKTIGLMCVKDEADLLGQVFPHIRGNVDLIYAYDDGSIDDTWNYIKHADYSIRRIDDKNRLPTDRGNYHHLLEKLKEDFPSEEVWCFITMGDRFFINKTPRQIVEEAESFRSVEGIQLDFLRHKDDPWTEENDPFPNYSNIRNICNWVRVDERCIVAFKLNESLSYEDSNYPWPKGIGIPQFSNFHFATKDMPFLEHQGRRSPKGFMWRHTYSRPLGIKYKHVDFSSFQKVLETNSMIYSPTDVIYWNNGKALNDILDFSLKSRQERDARRGK